MLADNEKFLKTKDSLRWYKQTKVSMFHVPPRSPDLNPVELYWAWLKKHLRGLDLKDDVAKKAALGKMMYQQRVRAVIKSQRSQEVAAACAKRWVRTCQRVFDADGAAVSKA